MVRRVGPSIRLLFLCVLAQVATHAAWAEPERCVVCHREAARGFTQGHAFAIAHCTRCHHGDAAATDQEQAHRGLIAFPGGLDNAQEVCGDCHPEQVAAVDRGLMHSGRGMVAVTRRVFGGHLLAVGGDTLGSLGSGPADSLLRKLCASCHLGQPKRAHALDVTRDRGGGCLACHINAYPGDTHPALTAKVEDGRCFGCHSRSGRIALSYAGLAELDEAGIAQRDPGPLGRLADGRWVESRPADVHHRAGMACIDCHTATGLMGPTEGAGDQREAVDIACEDCHRNTPVRLDSARWPERYRGLQRRIPYPVGPDQVFLTTARSGTPLWHIEVRDDGPYLHRKIAGGVLRIPQYTEASHPLAHAHARLTCAACHSQWAPQCYGCHLEYDPQGRQWDHLVRGVTPGRWRERSWDTRNGLPTLGVTRDDRIEVFVPGMILTLVHPDWQRRRFGRYFAALSPHTSGRARSCASCHRSPSALGLGRGVLRRAEGGWSFIARDDPLADGLPADAWTDLSGARKGAAIPEGGRPFDRAERSRVLDAPLGPPRREQGR
jgi:hypothetical protein